MYSLGATYDMTELWYNTKITIINFMVVTTIILDFPI